MTTLLPKITICLEENREISVSRDKLLFLGEDGLKAIREAFKDLVTVFPNWDGREINFRADSKVGVLEALEIRIRVIPWLSPDFFCTLIRYILAGQIPADPYRSHSGLTWETGFEDILGLLLSDETARIFKMGLSRRYEEEQEPLQVLRGRPIWEKNFPWQGGKTRAIHCRYHRLAYDNLDNRLLLAGLLKTSTLTSHTGVRRAILQNLNLLRGIASGVCPSPSDFELAFRGYNRLNEHYCVAHGLCRILLFGLRTESFFDGGKYQVSGIVLDMADMFELFVEKFTADLLRPAGYTLRAQAPDRKALLDGEDCPYASIRPDLELWRGESVCAVIDAKYKPYWKMDSDSAKPVRKIGNEDLYQLFFYQQRLQRKYHLSSPPKAFIATPLPGEEEEKNTCHYRRSSGGLSGKLGQKKPGMFSYC